MKRLILAAATLALSATAVAQTPSYNYFQAGYESVDIDDNVGINADGDGFTLGGSYVVADNWHIFGSYSTIGLDFSIDVNEIQLGGGYHTDISNKTSFFADLAWVRAEVEASGFGSVDDSGYGIAIGLRSNVTDRVELAGALSLVDFGDGGDSTAVSGAAWYQLNETFALGLTASIDDDVTSIGLGARAYFDL